MIRSAQEASIISTGKQSESEESSSRIVATENTLRCRVAGTKLEYIGFVIYTVLFAFHREGWHSVRCLVTGQEGVELSPLFPHMCLLFLTLMSAFMLASIHIPSLRERVRQFEVQVHDGALSVKAHPIARRILSLPPLPFGPVDAHTTMSRKSGKQRAGLIPLTFKLDIQRDQPFALLSLPFATTEDADVAERWLRRHIPATGALAGSP